MIAWQEIYQQRRQTSQEALKVVQSGHRVVTGHAAGEPVILLEALMEQKDRLRNVEIVHMVPIGACTYCQPDYAEHFHHNSLFVGGGTRQAVNEGRADYTPVFFSEIPRLFRDGMLSVDVALIQVSPPDADGYMSLGVSVDYTWQAAQSAKIVIVQVNPQMPHTLGTLIHVNDVNVIVEAEQALIEIPLPIIGPIEEKIGGYVASLVPDQANLQLGIGSIPDATLKFLRDKKHLGIHTEMFSDGVLDLYEAGVITNKYNNLNPGKFIATFLMGSKRLYDFVDNNPIVEMRPVDYTNNIMVAGKMERLISINSAIQVDLYGQVCSDSIGSRQFSGVGGQVDFVRAASQSPGGKSIIALPSTAKGGKVSRIVKNLDIGACVTTSRNDVHYVVTEFGIADLRGKSLRQRAVALKEIAHPDFRDQLD